MADFIPAMDIVFKREGGFANSRIDKGGATKYGISLKFLKACGIDKEDLDADNITLEPIGDLNNDGKVDIEDIRLISPDYAKKLYFKYFWSPLNASFIYDQRLATLVFDMAVNSGPKTAVIHLQRSLRQLGVGITVDGVLGPKSMNCVNSFANAEQLCAAFITNRKTFYLQIVQEDEKQAGNLEGWMNRIKLLKADLGLV